uniref:hypothetical protein n=1 Tax=uncultured Sphingomonas sp. TaxID=158754 RepID=UPI0035C95FED
MEAQGSGDSPASGLAAGKLDRIPVATLREMTDATKAIGFPGLAWRAPVVKVAFNGGDTRLYPLVEAAASEWTSQGGRLSFSFRGPSGAYRTWRENDTAPAADVRISFFTDKERGGYWSSVGVLARRLPAAQPTMNLGDLGTTLSRYYGGANAAEWGGSYAHSVILHEFGHALGLNHEHFHPQCQADLKMQQVLDYLTGPEIGWKLEQAKFNMEAANYFSEMSDQTNSMPVSMPPNIDRASVMLYSFPDDDFKSGSRSPCRPSGASGYATVLSSGDRAYFKRNYPATPRR